jgi:UDP-N-acetylglucosamine 1-carboxyvinyltransferase
MQKISISGGKALKGDIEISGSKNSALPIMAASLLTADSLVLTNIPLLNDIVTMNQLLLHLGVNLAFSSNDTSEADQNKHLLMLTAKDITDLVAPYDIVKQMRASVLVLGPLVARFGYAKVSLPGGCAIGARPINYHLQALEKMGAEVTLNEGYVEVKAPNGLKGADIVFPKVTVGATENTMMAATLATGVTRMSNAAREPEIIDLANCLIKMGAKIKGAGTDTIEIEGVAALKGAHHRIIADRIEAGTYAVAAAITGGCLCLKNLEVENIQNILDQIANTGSIITKDKDSVTIDNTKHIIKPIELSTEPFPGFPTDMQAQLMALLSVADGTSIITETIFENRYMHVPELNRLGANITINGTNAIVRGVKSLKGAPVMATDLRASVSLVLAGLVAQGETIVDRVYHLDRGYENLEQKLNNCGATVRRISADS